MYAPELIQQLKIFEGYSSRPYIDKITGRHVTIGHGHVGEFPEGTQLSRELAHELLVLDVELIDKQLINVGINFPPFKQSAIIELVFNIGFTKFKKSHLYAYLTNYTPIAKIDEYICSYFMQFKHAHDKNGNVVVVPALARRRKWDVDMWIK